MKTNSSENDLQPTLYFSKILHKIEATLTTGIDLITIK
jgi:hypothetical protein